MKHKNNAISITHSKNLITDINNYKVYKSIKFILLIFLMLIISNVCIIECQLHDIDDIFIDSPTKIKDKKDKNNNKPNYHHQSSNSEGPKYKTYNLANFDKHKSYLPLVVGDYFEIYVYIHDQDFRWEIQNVNELNKFKDKLKIN